MSNKNDGGTNVRVTITNDERRENGWVHGIAAGGFKFEAKVYDEGSVHGINKGRVSKLDIHKDRKMLVNYDRGWDIKPTTPEVKAVCESILKKLDTLGKTADIDGERRDFIGAVKANEGKVNHNRKFEVTIYETKKQTVEVEAANREEAERLVKGKWDNSEYVSGAGAFDCVEFNAEYIKREQAKQGGDIS